MIKKIGFALLISCFVATGYAQVKKAPSAANRKTSTVKTNTSKTAAVSTAIAGLSSSKDSLSYALGLDIARSLKSADFDLDIKVVQRALGDAFDTNKTVLLKEDQIASVIQSQIKLMMAKKNAELIKPGQDFLEANKKNPAVKVTSEGVQYEILKEGQGKQPTKNSDVLVHYKGTLINGDQFDSSYDRNEPINLSLDNVIQGWQIGIPLMKEGAKYKFYIPYHLAYGERATGSIPAFSTLIFEVELLKVNEDDSSK